MIKIPRTALVVDDHPFIRATVKVLLKKENFEVVGEAENGVEALQLAKQHDPELIILDISMPGLDGIDALVRIRELLPDARILILTSQPAEYFSVRCQKAGAKGYVCKSDRLHEMTKAINAIMSGYNYFPDVELSSVHRGDRTASEAEAISRLTDRELMILQQLSRGMRNQDVAEHMLISCKTVSTYKIRLLYKLKVRTLVDMADLAKRHRLI
jgi:two-component system response regulator EvgA